MFVRKILRSMFGLDWRSLALLRIGVAAIILADLAICAPHLREFYTDDGILPRVDLVALADPVFCVHLLGGSLWFESLLFVLEAICALLLLVGYRTRLAAPLCWLLLVSRQARNPLLLFGADTVLRVALFWAMFLPLNRRFSLDAASGLAPQPDGPNYLGLATFGAITQFLLIYVMSGLLKTGTTWHVDHSAVYYALALDIYSRPLGQWLNQFDGLTAFLTVATLYLEIYGPVLFILPWGAAWGRLLGFVVFASLQVGFATTMQMGLFAPVMIAFSFMLLPAEFWTWFAEPFGRRVAGSPSFAALRAHLKLLIKPPPSSRPLQSPPPRHLPAFLRRGASFVRDACLLSLSVIMLLYNVDSLPGHRPFLPARLYTLVDTLDLDQYFNMFAPDAQTLDGWFVMRASLRNGRNVDLLTGASPASFTKPASVADAYGDERTASVLIDLTFDDYVQYREDYLRYLARQWNDDHPPAQQIQTLEMIFMEQFNGPDHSKSAPVSDVLWTENYH